MTDGNYIKEAELEAYMGMAFDANSTPTATQIGPLIERAERAVINDIVEFHEQEDVTYFMPPKYTNVDGDWGQINGSNKVFFTRHSPVADWDADGSSDDKGDVVVATLDEDNDTWTEAESVDTLISKRGKITLDDAPSTNERIYVTYAHYVSGEIPNDDRLDDAILPRAAIEVIKAKAAPHSIYPGYSIGGLGMQHPSVSGSSEKQIERYEKSYKKAIRVLRRNPGLAV